MDTGGMVNVPLAILTMFGVLGITVCPVWVAVAVNIPLHILS